MTKRRYSRMVWTALAFTIVVIVWGAYVRASGSGAGCGKNWPMCKGGVWSIETFIELTHRLTSGIALILTVAIAFFGFRTFPRGHRVRKAAVFSLVFMITEALVGAGLVLLELVAKNVSVWRGLFISVHLTNTLILLAALALTGWWSAGKPGLQLRKQGYVAWLLAGCVVLTVLVGISGAIAALGDTLFPATSLKSGFSQDFSAAANLFVRLRVFHPVLAVSSGVLVVATSVLVRQSGTAHSSRILTALLPGLVCVQLLAGLANLLLLTPIWLQLIHLVLADFIWITLVLLCSTVLAEQGHGAIDLSVPSLATQSGMPTYR